jgi:hypothetical protein
VPSGTATHPLTIAHVAASIWGLAMDREMELRHLEQAERHVVEGARRIAEQEERVDDLARNGHDTTEARKLLNNFYASQAQHIQHRDLIRKMLEE